MDNGEAFKRPLYALRTPFPDKCVPRPSCRYGADNRERGGDRIRHRPAPAPKRLRDSRDQNYDVQRGDEQGDRLRECPDSDYASRRIPQPPCVSALESSFLLRLFDFRERA